MSVATCGGFQDLKVLYWVRMRVSDSRRLGCKVVSSGRRNVVKLSLPQASGRMGVQGFRGLLGLSREIGL